MIAELFTMLSTIDVSTKNGNTRFNVNMNRRNIRSISAFSSNSIFYFKTIVSDQVTPEEVGMVSRMLEKAYASFVVACIGLMPFHRVKADDQAAIESYLRQFHQNLGVSDGSDVVMSKVFNLATTITESAPVSITQEDIAVTQNFLMECWEKSRKNCSRYIELIADHITSVNEMYSVDPIDPVTRVFQEKYMGRLDELDSWGFIGEATANMLDNFDDVESMSDADIIRSMMSDDDDIDEDEFDDELLDEGNVKSAVNSIMFQLEAVSENKIKSCSSLTKLSSLEAKLNKLKNKYAKYLNRYKKKYKENQAKKTKSKLSIRFNGETISNPKAFMKQYGGYIKIINKRLKLVEKRREELRKKKGLPTDGGNDTPKLEETGIGVLSDLDLATMDSLIEAADKQLYAPDSEVFLEAPTPPPPPPPFAPGTIPSTDPRYATAKDTNFYGSHGATPTRPQRQANMQAVSDYIYDQDQRIRNLGQSNTNLQNQNREYQNRLTGAQRALDRSGVRRGELAASLQASRAAEKKLAQQVADLKQENEKLKGNQDVDKPDFELGDKTSLNIDWKKSRPSGGVNLGRAAANGQTNFRTFDDKIFTDMEMRKANEAIPTFAKASIGFVIDETEQVVTRDILVGIKVHIHKVPAMDLISDIYNCIINKRQFLKFVKWISGEEKSLADLLFCYKQLRTDALNSRNGKAGQWGAAFRRRKRWKDMSVPYLMKSYTPNGTVVLTMNEVQFIKDEYGLDVMRPDHVKMIMDSSFLLGFVILDQANEMVYVSYDGFEGDLQQYTYAMLERDTQMTDRAMRELYRSFSR